MAANWADNDDMDMIANYMVMLIVAMQGSKKDDIEKVETRRKDERRELNGCFRERPHRQVPNG
jgi:hypothetical protein